MLSIQAEPASGAVGDKIKITYNFTNFKASPSIDFLFNGDLWSVSDSAGGNSIYTFIPYISGNGPFYVTGRASYQTDTLYEICNAAVEININKPYGEGIHVITSDEPEFTEDDVYFYQPSVMNESVWQTEIKGDTVVLSLLRTIADECGSEYKIIFLNKGAGVLPDLIDYSVRTGCGPPFSSESTIHLENGLVKIAKWQPGKLYVGVIYSALEPDDNVNIMPPVVRFWGKL
jgi:hypothetical protein